MLESVGLKAAGIDAATLARQLAHLTFDERAELDALIAGASRSAWSPLPGPQSMAYYSLADVLGFGGAAGGGKSDLAIGKAMTRQSSARSARS